MRVDQNPEMLDKSSTARLSKHTSETCEFMYLFTAVKNLGTNYIVLLIFIFILTQSLRAAALAALSVVTPLTRDIRFWPYCPSKSFITHYQQARHVGYTSCISFGHHKVSLWPQSLPLEYSGSIAIPEAKHALLITLRTKKCRNK